MRTITYTKRRDLTADRIYPKCVFECAKRDERVTKEKKRHTLLIYFLHVHSRFIFPRFAGAHLQLLFMWAGGGKARHLGALSPAAPLGMLLMAIWIVSRVCVSRVGYGKSRHTRSVQQQKEECPRRLSGYRTFQVYFRSISHWQFLDRLLFFPLRAISPR